VNKTPEDGAGFYDILVLMYRTAYCHPRRTWTWFSLPVSHSDTTPPFYIYDVPL